jgi:gas vesicle protein
MDREAEVIKQQMEQTRAALSEKLETLEQQVVGTVAGATTKVAHTVDTVTEAVQETVATVKESVEETMASVKESLDLRRQVEQHPWLMMGGAVCTGYVGERLLERIDGRRTTLPPPQPRHFLGGPRRTPEVPTAVPAPEPAPPEPRAEPSWLTLLTNSFGPEIAKLKSVAIGAALGLVRDRIAEATPPHLQSQVTELLDSVTLKLGGEPAPRSSFCTSGDGKHNGAETGRPMGTL